VKEIQHCGGAPMAADPGQPHRHPNPFLVLPGGICVPLDGPFHVEEIRGEFYVLGRCSWERFDSFEGANRRLIERSRELDPHGLAREALAAHDPHF
jgi:hypothetical protein